MINIVDQCPNIELIEEIEYPNPTNVTMENIDDQSQINKEIEDKEDLGRTNLVMD